MNNTAIVLVDLQNDFFSDPDLKKDVSRLVKKVNELTAFGRSKKIPILWVRQEFNNDLSDAYPGLKKSGLKLTIKHTPGAQLLDGLDVAANDIHIIKKRYSAFFNTDLDLILKKQNTDMLIVGGVKTYSCVRMSVVDAYQRDYKIVLATDCLAIPGNTHDKLTLEYLSKYMAVRRSNNEIIGSIE